MNRRIRQGVSSEIRQRDPPADQRDSGCIGQTQPRIIDLQRRSQRAPNQMMDERRRFDGQCFKRIGANALRAQRQRHIDAAMGGASRRERLPADFRGPLAQAKIGERCLQIMALFKHVDVAKRPVKRAERAGHSGLRQINGMKRRLRRMGYLHRQSRRAFNMRLHGSGRKCQAIAKCVDQSGFGQSARTAQRCNGAKQSACGGTKEANLRGCSDAERHGDVHARAARRQISRAVHTSALSLRQQNGNHDRERMQHR